MTLKHWFEFTDDWRHAPLAYWVHVPQDGKDWLDDAAILLPPAPVKVSGRGYPQLFVAVKDVELLFSSPAQLRAFVDTLRMTPLPSTRRLSALRGTTRGPNSHWLSRLPGWMKAPAFRNKTLPRIADLADALADDPRWRGQAMG